jgi:2-polyprenyl-3-methyl-5-hydroxy-6-metoxy-1,4-benzoquinol methylase
MTSWDKVYSERFMTIWEPHETVVQFVARYLKRRLTYDRYQEQRRADRVLDLGCGNGAQSLFFARKGYDVYGVDLSKEAILFAEDTAKKDGVKATFLTQDCSKLSFENSFFDVILCYGMLDHILMDKALAIANEAYRVAKPGSLLFFSLASVDSSYFGKGSLVAHHSYILQETLEEGEVQHYFDEEEVRELLPPGRFRLLDVRHRREDQYSVSKGELFPKNWWGRWFITAEIVK